MTNRSVVLLAVAAAALGAYGCASPFHRTGAKLQLRPHALEIAAPPPARPSTYDAAVKAIGARDYARALDLLQVARSQQPNDPAILNAFGVAYDKLGRLDLSARYYAQARALDPGSEIVRRNIAYSDQLRARTLVTTAPAAAPTPQPIVVAAARPPKPVAIPGAPVPLIRVADNGALLIGHGMKVVDASGLGLAQPVKVALAQRGWSVPRSAPPTAPPQARTTVIYPAGGAAVAQALARTLHGPVRISVCNDNCTRVTLFVGQDARRWARGARS
jgi:hypothetical protein